MRAARWRTASAAAALLIGLSPAVSSGFAPAIACRDVVSIGPWQRIPIPRFAPVEGVDSADVVTSYGVASTRPQHVVATNGKRLAVSDTGGCSWSDGLSLALAPTSDVPLTGASSTIVSTVALPSGRVLAAIREGTGPGSRPHVIGSEDGRSGYRTSDTGLPPQGDPRFLEAAADGRTVYLTLLPTSGDGGSIGGGTVPGAPDATNPMTGTKAGLLYGSTDGGHSWTLRTQPADLPSGGGGLDRLAVDPDNANHLYALSNGLLVISNDGGGTFTRAPVADTDVTAVETGVNGQVFAFTASGLALSSPDGRHFATHVSRAGVTSAAYRRGDGRVAVETAGRLAVLEPADGSSYDVAGMTVTKGSLVGDTSEQASFHALSGHSLLRYADRPSGRGPELPVTVSDLGVPAPPPGTITPAGRTVRLQVGTSSTVGYTLSLPRSPTPLDLMFLIDTSGSMSDYIEDLKRNINRITHAVQSAGIDLRVGVATLGTGPTEGERVGPYFDPQHPGDRGPQLYQLFRRIGPVDAEFGRALASVHVKEPASGAQHEAQLAALEQATAGLGIRDPRSPAAAPLFLVPPGQGAQWRQGAGIRRLIVHATDEPFESPAGSPMRNGKLDFAHTISLLREYHVQQIGLTIGALDAHPDLARIARGTRTFAPPGGADCGAHVVLPSRQPLVCDTTGDISAMLGRLVRSLTDRQTVQLSARSSVARVVGVPASGSLRSIDVTTPNTLRFHVGVSCKGQPAGTYPARVEARLRDIQVAGTELTVDCVAPAAAIALAPTVVVGAVPPLVQAPAAVVPVPPAAQPQLQPQSQPQVQSQVNPVTAAALQQQEDLQLALARQADRAPETGEQLAMVNRRKGEEGAALALLAGAMAGCAALALVRLRSSPAVSRTVAHSVEPH
jgi:hypothetical protein